MSANQHKPNQSKPFKIAIDAEWVAKTGEAVTVQLSLENGSRYLIVNDRHRMSLPEGQIESITNQMGINLLWADLTSGDFDCLLEVTRREPLPKNLMVLMFYSPKDLILLHGRHRFDTLALPETDPEQLGLVGEITQKRNIWAKYKMGYHKIEVRDLMGWSNGSLKTLAASVAIELADKGAMDDYKMDMLLGFQTKPDDYIRYAMGDTDCLLDIYQSFTANQRELQLTDLNLPEDKCYTEESVPMTNGSLVAKSIQKFLENLGSPGVAEVAYRKLGELNLSQKRINKPTDDRKARDLFFTEVNSLDKLQAFLSQPEHLEGHQTGTGDPETIGLAKAYKRVLTSEYASVAYSLGSPQAFGRDTKTTTAHLAPVHGGRALNEIPSEYRLENVLDADLSSAYATAMCSLTYPIGRPRIESFTGNQRRFTLKEALKKLTNATSGCWMVVVSGKLPFAQDLIMSKDVSVAQINKAVACGGDDETEGGLSKIPGDVVHLRHEIINGVITQDILEIIQKVSSSNELKGFMSLEVVAMAYHLETDKFTDFDQWADVILRDKGQLESVSGEVCDTRTHAWFALPLSEIFGKLTEKRKAIKKEAKALKPLVDQGDPEARKNYDRLEANQQARKLFINTGYGTIGSVYFQMSNSIVGNNITAKVRANAWMMAKALRCPQLITDGGLFTPEKVRFVKPGKLPSFNTLSSPKATDGHRSIKLGKLGDRSWVELFQQAKNDPMATISIFQNAEAERLTIEHINAFWKPWELALSFAIELKTGHEALSASYLGKADYCLMLPSGQHVFRIRGTRNFEDDHVRHPKYEILERLALGLTDLSGIDLNYDHTYLLKIGRYQQASRSTGWAYLDGIAPGEEVTEARSWKFNNSFIPIDLFEDYQKIQRRGNRSNDGGLFERHLDRGWDYLLDKALENKLSNMSR